VKARREAHRVVLARGGGKRIGRWRKGIAFDWGNRRIHATLKIIITAGKRMMKSEQSILAEVTKMGVQRIRKDKVRGLIVKKGPGIPVTVIRGSKTG